MEIRVQMMTKVYQQYIANFVTF